LEKGVEEPDANAADSECAEEFFRELDLCNRSWLLVFSVLTVGIINTSIPLYNG